MNRERQVRGGSKYAGAFFTGAQNLVVDGGTFMSVTNILHNTAALSPSVHSHIHPPSTAMTGVDDHGFISPDSAKYAGSFFTHAQDLIINGGIFISITNIIHHSDASDVPTQAPLVGSHLPPSSTVMDCDQLAESEELTLDLRPKGAKHAGAFFSRAQGLVIGAGTFASITNIVHNMPVFTDMFPSELFEGPLCDLLAEQRLYGTVGRWDCIRRISAVKVDHRKSLMAPTMYEKEVPKQRSAKSSSLRFEPKKHTAEKVVHLQYCSLVSISDVCAQDSDVINFRSLVGVHLMLPGQCKVDCTSGIQHSTSHSSRFYDPPPNRAPSSHNLDINRGIIKLVRLLRQGMGWPRGWGHVSGLPTQDLTVVPVSLLPVAPPASRSSLPSRFNRVRTTEASKFESSAIQLSASLLCTTNTGLRQFFEDFALLRWVRILCYPTIRPLGHSLRAWMAGTLG